MRAAGIGMEKVINLIKIANNDLSTLEQKYQKLKKDVNLLESQKFKDDRILHKLEVQITDSKRMLKWLDTSYQEEEANIDQLVSEKYKRFRKQDSLTYLSHLSL
jgi:hypothetical protein